MILSSFTMVTNLILAIVRHHPPCVPGLVLGHKYLYFLDESFSDPPQLI